MGVLLNRYSKRRSTYKKVNVSGAKASDVDSAKKKLDEYLFLSWLDVFIRPKNTKSNVINSLGTSLAIDEAIERESSMDAYPPPSESGTFRRNIFIFNRSKRKKRTKQGSGRRFWYDGCCWTKIFSGRKNKIKHVINQVLYNNHVAIGPSSSNLTYIQPQVVS